MHCFVLQWSLMIKSVNVFYDVLIHVWSHLLIAVSGVPGVASPRLFSLPHNNPQAAETFIFHHDIKRE